LDDGAKGLLTGGAMVLIVWVALYALGVLLRILKGGAILTLAAASLAKDAAEKGAEAVVDFHNRDKKKCPFCAEMIKREAVVCRHCHRSVEKCNASDENSR
jgi:hypothetical protein